MPLQGPGKGRWPVGIPASSSSLEMSPEQIPNTGMQLQEDLTPPPQAGACTGMSFSGLPDPGGSQGGLDTGRRRSGILLVKNSSPSPAWDQAPRLGSSCSQTSWACLDEGTRICHHKAPCHQFCHRVTPRAGRCPSPASFPALARWISTQIATLCAAVAPGCGDDTAEMDLSLQGH